MCMRNVHMRRPTTTCGWVGLVCSYTTCFIAAGLVAANILPYHLFFLPRLSAACANGKASYVYYYYCLAMMLFAEFMVYFDFLLAIFTAPGYVPHEPWARPPVFDGKEYSDNPFEVRQLDRQNKLRYCSLCEQFKPDNAHHCTMCGRCIYRMDHHCPWINNCVGRNNTKYFLLFVSYIPLGAFHIVFTTLYSSIYHIENVNLFTLDGDVVTLLGLCCSMGFSLVMGFAFCAFAANFVWMAYRGETSMSRSIAAKMGPERVAELNKLVREEQLYEVFGADRRWWRIAFPFSPVRDHRGLPGYTMVAAAELMHTV